ncbi:MBOAT family O-acyltransferase [Botryobacter ruber]|uniref:MBOAT family O-acyltransferase n=1 Tax=Botryobacter ruber TaxID=2171629 RepID=UPI000E0A5D67|nr:MBOAT family O-acyltransferase [Botryobacter ruber]
MLFNSFEFLVFFPTVVFLYFLLPHRFRWLLLLVASYVFYMFWRAEYILLLIISTLVDYGCSRMMGRYSNNDQHKRKPWLWLSLVSNLGILFSFKYFGFFGMAANDLAVLFGIDYAVPALELLLPMGISFYTFQTMSYSIDVYYGRIQPEKHLGRFALFVTFFPQLVAGPIERAGNLLSQLRERHEFNYQQLSDGLKLMAWGFFKKLVIADRLAVVVNQAYNEPAEYSGLGLAVATIFFSFQIYCDFSGYSDIAIGAAQVMGINLMQNFRRPFFARSVREFWSRWHISLSTWFRDYVYIPLGGNRVVKWRWYYNLFLTFVISGLWHGANWTFLIWGALHGFYLLFAIQTEPQRNKLVYLLKVDKQPKLYTILQIGTTFALVSLAFLFFRANTVTDAWYILNKMVVNAPQELAGLMRQSIAIQKVILFDSYLKFFYMLLMIGLLLTVEKIQSVISIRAYLREKPLVVRWSLSYLLILVILFLGAFETNEFIYFQF